MARSLTGYGGMVSSMICIRVSHCIYADVVLGLCWLYLRIDAWLLRWCVFRVHTDWTSANGNVRSRVRWFPRIYGDAWPNACLYISLFIQGCTEVAFCLRKYHLAEKYFRVYTGGRLLVPLRQVLYFPLDISLLFSRPMNVLGQFCVTNESLLFFFLRETTVFYCIVLSRESWLLDKNSVFSLSFFSFSFLHRTVPSYWKRGPMAAFRLDSTKKKNSCFIVTSVFLKIKGVLRFRFKEYSGMCFLYWRLVIAGRLDIIFKEFLIIANKNYFIKYILSIG